LSPLKQSMTEEDIQRRLPVWSAFSELFLDTELTEHNYRSIVQRAGSAGFAPDELHAILVDEVFPRFAFNLFGLAGDWQPWADDSVRDVMLGPKPWAGSRLVSRLLHGKYIEQEWTRVRDAMQSADGPDQD
jgi:hypothetical protein